MSRHILPSAVAVKVTGGCNQHPPPINVVVDYLLPYKTSLDRTNSSNEHLGKSNTFMAAWPSSSSSSSYPSSSQWRYDVFLSFCGQDTRKSFTDHLYAALTDKGINTFKDDPDLERGKPLDQIHQAIKDSRFSIVIFSSSYASSTWCLEELLTIFNCIKRGRQQKVFPVFYHVDPSEVRKQTGRYGEAFKKHEETFSDDINKVERWRMAIKEVASISGWDLKNKFSSDFKDLVGMKSRMQKMSSYLAFEQTNEVRVIGICGMGGIGKSTIARVAYMNFASQFEGSCFLENVRVVEKNHGLAGLQEQLLSDIPRKRDQRALNAFEREEEIRTRLRHKRVFVVLDNVNHLNQLKKLAGEQDWFGKGTRIIITTRDKHLLDCFGVDKVYQVEGLNHDEALELFLKKAFPNDSGTTENFVELSHQFVKYANRLPLALNVLGSSVYGRSINAWRDTLARLRRIPDKEILASLEMSFDDLNRDEKDIFLDIACFFVGEHVQYISEVLKSCGFYPDIGICVLIDKNLITVSNDIVWMHDQLQQMGQEIVLRESYTEAGQRSRLWHCEDIDNVLRNNTGTEKVEGIALNWHRHEVQRHLSGIALLKMKNIRLLRLKNLHLSSGFEGLSNLRYLEWHEYPFKCLPSAFQPNKLVSLQLPHSSMVQLWKGSKHLENLEVINLSHSKNLTKTPDFNGLPNLKKLNLEGCSKLYEVHQSIGVLRILMVLNLRGCNSLRKLPDSICNLKSLEILDLQHCTKLNTLPERLCELRRLKVFETSGIRQRQLTAFADLLPFLLRRLLFFFLIVKVLLRRRNSSEGTWQLLPRRNPNLKALILPSLPNFCCLRELCIWNCSPTEEEIPSDLSCLPSLQWLLISTTNLKTLPRSINQLSKLESLACLFCDKLQSLPDLPLSITHLFLKSCPSLETLPAKFFRCPELKSLYLNIGTKLHSILDLPSSTAVNMSGCISLESRSLESLKFNDSRGIKNFLRAIYLVLFYPNCSLSVSFTASKIPGWFNYRVTPSSSKSLHLPSNWCNDDWIGFSICISVTVRRNPFPSYPVFFDSSLFECRPPNPNLFLNGYYMELCFTNCSTDNLCFIFIPSGNLGSGHRWNNTFSHFYFDLSNPYGDDVEVKEWGFRVVYKEDVEELIRCKGFPERKGVLIGDKWHGDGCCGYTEEVDHPRGNFFLFELDNFRIVN